MDPSKLVADVPNDELPSRRPAPDSGRWRANRRVFQALIAMAALALALASIVRMVNENLPEPRYRPVRTISLAEPAEVPDVAAEQPVPDSSSLRVAIAPVISPERSLRLYANLVDYLAAELGRSPVVLQRETYLEVNDLVRFGRCDLAFVCTYAFIRGEREFGMAAIAVPQVSGATTYHSLVIVPDTSRANSLLDLQGQRFASADLLSNSGWLYPATWLQQHGKEPDTFFGRHVITGSHDQSVTAVARRFVDGAAVDSLVYEQVVRQEPAIAAQTRTILKSPPFGMPPLVVPPRIDPSLRQALLEALLNMHQAAEGRKILASLQIDRFVVPEAGLYDSVRAAAAQVEARP
jgi:phosphonate transport system substrate-binding protein